MKRKLVSFAVISCFAGLLVAAAVPAGAGDARLVAFMTGANERPGPGDPDGVGRAVVTINDAANQLCVAVQFTGITLPATGFHIHFAPTTSSGPIVVPFANPTTNQVSQCVTVENEDLLDNIAANPGQYYINIHTQPLYAAGALRGQLQAG
jgi:hypothetical protein